MSFPKKEKNTMSRPLALSLLALSLLASPSLAADPMIPLEIEEMKNLQASHPEMLPQSTTPNKNLNPGQRHRVEQFQAALQQAKVNEQRLNLQHQAESIQAMEGVKEHEANLLLAARNGDVVSQRRLGLLYSTGQGLRLDKAEGKKWLEQAAAQGDQTAMYMLERLH